MTWIKGYDKLQIIKSNIKDILERYEINCICDARLESTHLRYSEDSKGEYWLYCHCIICGYDYSYPKIYNQWLREKSAIAQVNQMFEGVDLEE